jgi:gluconokinase
MRIVYVMGVAGSGKSSVGSRLALELGWDFVEGDDFHPPANREKMAAGVPLEDSDRWEWLAAVRREVERILADGHAAVVACSALKRSYRSVLRHGVEGDTAVVYLRLNQESARRRIRGRRGHSFPATLLDSQFATLEEPRDEVGVLEVDSERPIEEIVEEVARWLGARGGSADRSGFT